VDLFDLRHTCRPDEALLYRRGDSNDVRLGEVVRTAPADYPGAQVVIVGCPQDEGVRRNGGRAGAAAAPTEIRRALYKLSINSIESVRLFDLGDIVIQPTLEETHDLHQRVVRQIVEDGKRLIVLGGGNDIAYPDCAGLVQAGHSDALAFNIDAHLDVRADPIRNSGTPYRQLLEEGCIAPDNFFEIGYQPFANSPVYERYLRDRGAHLVSLAQLRTQEISRIFSQFLRLPTLVISDSDEQVSLEPIWRARSSTLPPIFWGFDLDVVRAADAPGVSAPNPIGMTGDELCRIAGIAGFDRRTRIVEFSEVNPSYDVDGRTARLTAVAIWHVLAAMARRSLMAAPSE